ncbi:MAG: Ig domain protein, group 2 domain protein [Candidatus Magasanikbacteria bacterium GW2011_GWC2_34_16]|uniref:Ig domain protein, group 2 domain protein n=2 Tax=Candidatus Magasanikiibacteriota TaxID=1752731 RepID=A0A0G0JWR8_9BACT|nr:MAG: Ig domain protein, group 2 domain protein [Candidatus Magasanikbacteria bacterium GW2011_GWC2_34_16]KKQ41289.1 MAG: Ig domain protein, group 2 domain protein [Candidatus Magasanikbacteria bacterium GW2011_GWA2_37_8]
MVELEPGSNITPGITKEQKIGFILLLFFAIFAVGLGILQIRNTMYAPFALNNKVPDNLSEEVNTIDALRFRDTDQDGLTDFDELYVYTTSPYLADTDSDGLTDKQEIDKGTNPVCGEGKDCEALAVAETELMNKTASGTPAIDLTMGVQIDAGTIDIMQVLQDPKQVRELLISSGVDATLLEKISDADLMKMVSETMATTSTLENAN